jgi:hypothetical protein
MNKFFSSLLTAIILVGVAGMAEATPSTADSYTQYSKQEFQLAKLNFQNARHNFLEAKQDFLRRSKITRQATSPNVTSLLSNFLLPTRRHSSSAQRLLGMKLSSHTREEEVPSPSLERFCYSAEDLPGWWRGDGARQRYWGRRVVRQTTERSESESERSSSKAVLHEPVNVGVTNSGWRC